MQEKDAFMKGKKLVAILSDAVRCSLCLLFCIPAQRNCHATLISIALSTARIDQSYQNMFEPNSIEYNM